MPPSDLRGARQYRSTAIGRELDGVADQIDERLQQPALIGHDVRHLSIDRAGEALLLFCGLWLHQQLQLLAHTGQADGRGLHLELTGFDGADVEQVGDQTCHTIDGADDGVDLHLLLIRADIHLEQSGREPNSIHGIAQIVRDDGQHIITGSDCLFGAAECTGQAAALARKFTMGGGKFAVDQRELPVEVLGRPLVRGDSLVERLDAYLDDVDSYRCSVRRQLLAQHLHGQLQAATHVIGHVREYISTS